MKDSCFHYFALAKKLQCRSESKKNFTLVQLEIPIRKYIKNGSQTYQRKGKGQCFVSFKFQPKEVCNLSMIFIHFRMRKILMKIFSKLIYWRVIVHPFVEGKR